jgi:hypothetical protein
MQQTGKLHNQRFVLNGITNHAILEDFSGIYQPGIYEYPGGTGELYIRSVKERTGVTMTDGNGSYHPFIISGTFHFTTSQHGQLLEIRNGRFDFHFSRNNLEYQ